MAKLIQSDHAKGIQPTPYPGFAGQAVTHRYSIAVPADAGLNDILELACIPSGCRVAEIVLDADKLDSNGAPTLTLDVGIMSGAFGDADAGRTCGAEFFAAATTGQAGGVARPTLASAYRTAGAATSRAIGVKIKAAAATGAAGTIGLTVTVVAA